MLNALIENWNALYASHAVLRTGVEFAHIGGLLVGGGCAIATDLATVTAARDGSIPRLTELRLLQRTHRLVVLGLVSLFVSGLLLLAADVETYLYSWTFWIKMALVAALLVNGARLLGSETRVRNGDTRAWTRLHHAAVASLTLWFLITLVGAALPNLG